MYSLGWKLQRYVWTLGVNHSRDGRFTSIMTDLFEKIAAELLTIYSKTNVMSNDDHSFFFYVDLQTCLCLLGKNNFDEGNVKQAGYQRGTIPLQGFDRSLGVLGHHHLVTCFAPSTPNELHQIIPCSHLRM